MKPLLARRLTPASQYAWERACKSWRFVALGLALATGGLHTQAQTPPSPALPAPAQAASAAPLPVLGTLILSPLERRQLDAASQLVTNDQGGFLVSAGGQSRVAAPVAPMFWINRQPPADAITGGALSVLSGNLGSANAGTKDTISSTRPGQAAQNPGAALPPGAITINRATPRAGERNPSRAPVN